MDVVEENEVITVEDDTGGAYDTDDEEDNENENGNLDAKDDEEDAGYQGLYM